MIEDLHMTPINQENMLDTSHYNKILTIKIRRLDRILKIPYNKHEKVSDFLKRNPQLGELKQKYSIRRLRFICFNSIYGIRLEDVKMKYYKKLSRIFERDARAKEIGIGTVICDIRTSYRDEKRFLPKNKEEYYKINENLNQFQRHRAICLIFYFYREIDISRETVHLAINFLDRYISNNKIDIKDLDTIAFACLYEAHKLGDNRDEVTVSDFITKTAAGKVFKKKNVYIQLTKIKNYLKYHVWIINPLAFTYYLYKVSEFNYNCHDLSEYIMAICSLYDDFVGIEYSKIAVGAAKLSTTVFNVKTKLFKFFNRYKKSLINEMEDKILEVIMKNGIPPLLKEIYRAESKNMRCSVAFLDNYIYNVREDIKNS